MNQRNVMSLVTGGSGNGKTSSTRNMGKDTLLINIELKPLPYKSNGIINYELEDTKSLFKAIEALPKKDNIKNVVIDSFSEWLDILLNECQGKYSGFDIWKHYNATIFRLFKLCKSINKYFFFLAHTEVIQDGEEVSVIRTKVKGKEWEGLVEKVFVNCFYARVTPSMDEEDRADYLFVTNTNGKLPAKTPMGMFEEITIGNDLVNIVEKIDEYYGYTAPKKKAPPPKEDAKTETQTQKAA